MKTILARFVFGGVRGNPIQIDLGLLLLRIAVGTLLCTVFEKFLPRDGVWGPQPWFVNDVAKMGFPLPTFFAWCAVLSEFFGGIMIVFGLLTRPAALANAITTFVAAFIFHKGQISGPGLMGTIFFAATAALTLTGPGRFSIDALFAGPGLGRARQSKPGSAVDEQAHPA